MTPCGTYVVVRFLHVHAALDREELSTKTRATINTPLNLLGEVNATCLVNLHCTACYRSTQQFYHSSRMAERLQTYSQIVITTAHSPRPVLPHEASELSSDIAVAEASITQDSRRRPASTCVGKRGLNHDCRSSFKTNDNLMLQD